MTDEGHHTSDRLLVGAPPIADRPRTGAERLLADFAPVALTLLAMGR